MFMKKFDSTSIEYINTIPKPSTRRFSAHGWLFFGGRWDKKTELVLMCLMRILQLVYMFSTLWVYETLRNNVDNWAFHLGFKLIILPETGIVGEFLRRILGSGFHEYVLFYFYVSFYTLWLVVAGAIYFTENKLFFRFWSGIMGMSFFSLLFFFFLPTAPPWMLGYPRVLWELPIVPDLVSSNLGFFSGNSVAAFPSHHAGWCFYLVFWLIEIYGRKARMLLIIPIMVSIATWYGSEHYVIDSIFGLFLAFGFFQLSKKFKLSL